MKRMPPTVTYTILRLLTFIVPLAILLLLGFNEWFSAIVAALIGFGFSLIFLRRSRDQVSAAIHNRRTGADAVEHDTPTDEETEDDVIEHAEEDHRAHESDTAGEDAAGEDAAGDAADSATTGSAATSRHDDSASA